MKVKMKNDIIHLKNQYVIDAEGLVIIQTIVMLIDILKVISSIKVSLFDFGKSILHKISSDKQYLSYIFTFF